MNSDTNEPFGLEQMQEIAEEILGSITWHDTEGDLDRCPGEYLHTAPNKQADCKVYLDNVPTIYCLHTSCHGAVVEANRNLRSAIGKAKWMARPPTNDEQLAMHRRSMERKQVLTADMLLKRRAQQLKQRILTDYAWSLDDAIRDSPVKLPDDPREHWRLILSLFGPRNTIWIGEKEDSGGRRGRDHFKSAAEWLECEDIPPGHFTCPAVFKPYSTSRCNQAVLYKRFLVVESDMLSKPDVLTVFRWCRQFLPLNAIVDTAGKSLHGWFDRLGMAPGTDLNRARTLFAELETVLVELGCDSKMFGLSQPCRLPGALRDGKRQRLIWFDRAAPVEDWPESGPAPTGGVIPQA
jgi:hypothetical protein